MLDRTKFGQKHRCPFCGIKFYDMNKTPVVCPQCGKQIDYDLQGDPDTGNDDEFLEEVQDITPDGDEVLDVNGIEETLEDDTPIEPEVAEDE